MATLGFLLLVPFAVSAMADREATVSMEGEWMESPQRASQRPTEEELVTLEQRLGYKFKNIDLLLNALTHPSFSGASNDVLHMLGAKLVEQAAALQMIMENSEISKGELNDFIVKHSNAKECAKEAAELGLDSLVMVAKGVDINSRILSTAFYAVFGAITVDNGPSTANFVYWKLKKWKPTMVHPRPISCTGGQRSGGIATTMSI